MFKRIGLFLLTNFLFITTISILLNVLGVKPYLSAQGIDYENLLIFCAVWGFAGSFFSLAISRMMAKWSMGVKLFEPNDPQFGSLVQEVHEISRRAGLSTMPEVGVYESPEVNAFATGPTRNRSLVAVSTGLLRQMRSDEVRGVLAHEVAHIVNGDMVTMTLLQGIVNTFVMFFARIAGYAASQGVKEENRHMVQMLVTIVLDIVLGLLGSMVVAAYSRHREFKADAGSASLVGKEAMIGGLTRLQKIHGHEGEEEEELPEGIKTMMINGRKQGGLMALLASHPPLEERIAALQNSVLR